MDRADEFGQLSCVTVSGPSGFNLGEHPGGGGDKDVMTGPSDAVAGGLGQMAFPGTKRADDENGNLFCHEPAGRQLRSQGAVDVGVEGKVELLLERADHCFAWSDIKQDVEALQGVTITEQNKTWAVRTECVGACGKVFQAMGVAVPPTIRELLIVKEP